MLNNRVDATTAERILSATQKIERLDNSRSIQYRKRRMPVSSQFPSVRIPWAYWSHDDAVPIESTMYFDKTTPQVIYGVPAWEDSDIRQIGPEPHEEAQHNVYLAGSAIVSVDNSLTATNAEEGPVTVNTAGVYLSIFATSVANGNFGALIEYNAPDLEVSNGYQELQAQLRIERSVTPGSWSPMATCDIDFRAMWHNAHRQRHYDMRLYELFAGDRIRITRPNNYMDISSIVFPTGTDRFLSVQAFTTLIYLGAPGTILEKADDWD